MIFEQIATGGCQSYLVGCEGTLCGALIDPEISQVDRYRALANHHGVHIRYVIDTHTHADHFSAGKVLSQALSAPLVMHASSPAPHANLRLDDDDMLLVGDLRIRALHTPGHTSDSMCLIAHDRVFTGDTLLIGGTGRTDLPTGDPDQLYDSLFGKLLRLDPDLAVFPAHDYKGGQRSTLGREIAENPRLQKRERGEFTRMMRELNLAAPTHLTEALRTNMTGGKTVGQMLAEAAAVVPFMAMTDLDHRIAGRPNDLMILDVREAAAFQAGHIPGARNVPRGQLELRVDEEIPDPTVRIVTCCEFGKISTLAALTLRELGYPRVTALDGGMKAWRESGFPVES
ncbi:MAG TPA: MBL fold metallo-hydrolase [Caulobacteraceae bacterium]|jgi:glyoxylase-like metal-dependent hydrolase (beta-lactamase superfamily II)/rhodanese-related sulfurtransferase